MSERDVQKILVIDDNHAIHDDFRKILVPDQGAPELDELEASLFGGDFARPVQQPRRRYEIHSAYQGEDGLVEVERAMSVRDPFALAFVDMRMPPGWDGARTIEEIWKVDPEIQIVVCTAYSDYSWEELVERFGSTDRLLILKKPFDTAEVCQLACALTEKWHLARRAYLKLNQLQEMIRERTCDLERANADLLSEVDRRREWEERYRLAAVGANDGLWDWNVATDHVYYSPRFKSMLGLRDDQMGDSLDDWSRRIHPEEAARWKSEVDSFLESGEELFRHEYRMRHSDGQYRWVLARGTVVRNDDGSPVRAAGSVTDVTDRKLAEEQLQFEALHDALTGLANRRLLHERIARCIAYRERHPEFHFAVMLIDLDHFKVVNDSLGHNVGDALLTEVAGRLRVSARKLDMVSRLQGNQVARIGGDEFVVLLEGLSTGGDALRVAERIHEALARPFAFEGNDLVASASIGICTSDTSCESPDDVLRDADTAMYRAKRAGKSCTRLFDPEMHRRAMQRWTVESDLRKAIEAGTDICVHYQPIHSADGEVVAVEALVRWNHPTLGFIGPDQFVPIAEETGLIVPLGRLVLQKACWQLARWQEMFPSLSCTVNVSSRQFAAESIVEDVMDAIGRAHIDPKYVCLEITESAAMADMDHSVKVVTRLQEQGIRVYMDDFGTGYSSLSQLHRVPLDALKIDRTFVTDMMTDSTSASIVKAIVAVARSMNLLVVAEGVETAEQAKQLTDYGCNFLQGFHFSKPLPASDFERYATNAASIRQPRGALQVAGEAQAR